MYKTPSRVAACPVPARGHHLDLVQPSRNVNTHAPLVANFIMAAACDSESQHMTVFCTSTARIVTRETQFKDLISNQHFSSTQFKMISMRSEKPIILCAPPVFSEVSPTLPLKRFQCSSE